MTPEPRSTTRVRHALLGVARRAHARSGWSCRELARRAGMSHCTVLRVLRGRQLSLDSLEALLVALEVDQDLVHALYAARDADGRLLVLPVDGAEGSLETPPMAAATVSEGSR